MWETIFSGLLGAIVMVAMDRKVLERLKNGHRVRQAIAVPKPAPWTMQGTSIANSRSEGGLAQNLVKKQRQS
jgi:hypothetical protein